MKYNNNIPTITNNNYWPSALDCAIIRQDDNAKPTTNRKQQSARSPSCDPLNINSSCCFINSPMLRPLSIKPHQCCNSNTVPHNPISPSVKNHCLGNTRQFLGCKKKRNIIFSQSHSREYLSIFTSLVILFVIEFASHLTKTSRNYLISNNVPYINHNYHLLLPSCTMAEAIKLTNSFDKYHHNRYRNHYHHQQHPQYHFEKDAEQPSNHDKLKETDDANYFNNDHQDLSNLPSKFYDENDGDDDDLTSEINSFNNNNSSVSDDVNNNNGIEKSGDTSPVVVISGVNSYVSASPISIENMYNHKNHQYTKHHHIRPTHTNEILTSSSEASISMNKNISNDIISNTEGNIDFAVQPEKSLNSDNDEYLFTSRHSIASQQNKRSNVHDELMEKGMKVPQNDEPSRSDNSPAEMFVTSPFGSSSNSLRSKFSMNPATIIRTRESLALGAIFLNHTYIEDFNSCLNDCWQSQACDTAIYQETPAPLSSSNKQADGYSKNDYVCYQFSCFKEGKLICKFTPHNYYVSSFLKQPRLKATQLIDISIDGHKIDSTVHSGSSSYPSAQEMELHQLRKTVTTSDHQQMNQGLAGNGFNSLLGHKSNSNSELDRNDEPRKTISHKLESSNVHRNNEDNSKDLDSFNSGCRRFQFKCHSDNECIAIYNICDGINQCLDGSDEKYCSTTTTEPTLTNTIRDVHKNHRKNHWNKAWDTNKDPNFFDLGATVHPMGEFKEQYDDSFKQSRLNYLPNFMDVPKQNPVLVPNSQLDDISFNSQLYPSIDSNLGVEGFFDKDSGRFITYNEAANSIYSLDNNALLFSPQEQFKHGGTNDFRPMLEKSNEKINSKSVSFHHKALSSVDSPQEKHKTFLVPNSYNQVDQSDKLTDMESWRHLDGKNDRGKTQVHDSPEQNSRQELRQLDKISVNSAMVNGEPVIESVAKDARLQPSMSKSLNEHKDSKEAGTISKSHHFMTHTDSGKKDESVINRVTQPDAQSLVYNEIKDGRFHSNRQNYWRDTHIASITIGEEENDDFSARGTHSALIAFMFGVAITGMLIVIVGLKMKSIRKKLVRRGRRRSLVHEADFLINGMHL